MNSPAVSAAVIDRLGWVLVHSLWQFVMVVVVARLLKGFLHRASSETRYAALVTAFSMIVLTPVVTGIFYQPPVSPILPAKTAVATESPVVASTTRVADIDGFASSTIEPSHADSTQNDGRPRRAVSWSAVEQFVRPWLNAIVAIWCCGVLAFTLRPVLGWYNLRRLCHVGVSPVPANIREMLNRTAERFRVCRAIRILQSTLVQVPLVVGYLRPAILLPVSIATNLPALQLESILAHELAHIRRHDYLVNLLQTLVETVFFYHPAVWWLSREIRRERENCCDDLAIAWLGNRLEYGRALLSVEELRATAPALALGATGGSLVARVRRLLVVEPARRSLSYSWSAGTAASCLALAIGLAASLSVLAQTKPPRESAASVVDQVGATDRQDDAASRSLDVIIAEHALLLDGTIVTWDQLVESFRAIRQQAGKPLNPRFHVTNGAIQAGLWDRYRSLADKVEQELFEPHSVSFRWMSHRAATRYDAVRTAADLAPKSEWVRSGTVHNAAGSPSASATVVLLPVEAFAPEPVMLQPDLSLRDPLDEVWTRTDKEGRFRLAAPDTGYRLAVVSPGGFALAAIPKPGEQIELKLVPHAEIAMSNADNSPQVLSFQLDLPSLPDSCWGFAIHGFSLGEEPETIRLPPGRLTVSRELDLFRGMKNVVLADQFLLKSGEMKKFSLPAPNPEANSKVERPRRTINDANSAKWSEKTLRSLSKPTNVEFTQLPLEDALQYLSLYHEVSIRIDREALIAGKISPDTPVTASLNNAQFHWVLKTILEPAKLGYFVDADGFAITTQEKAAADPKADGSDGRQKAAIPPAAAKPLLARSEQVQRTLRKPTTVNFRELPLTDAVKFLAEFHEIDIRVDKESLHAAKISLDESPVTLKLDNVSLRSVLQLLLEPMQLGYFVDEGGLVITTQEKAAEHSATDDKSRSLDIAVAVHVLMWDGEIVTWEEVVDGLRTIRKQKGEPIHPNFKFTNGAIKAGLWDRYQKAAFVVYEELFEPAGMSIGSMSPRAGERYDAIRTENDLIPNSEHVRTGVVRNTGGRPATVAIVVLMPEDSVMPVMLQPNLSLRDTLDEVWVRTDKQGRFRIACPDTGYKLVVLSPAGFALAPVPKAGEQAEIKLIPNSELELKSADKSPHELGISVHLPGMPVGHSGFSIYEIKIGEQSKTLRLPPGHVTVSRVVERNINEGTTRHESVESFELTPGEKKMLSIVPLDSEDQE